MISLKKEGMLTISSEQQMHMFGTYPKVMNVPSTVQTLLALGTQRALVAQCRLRNRRNREMLKRRRQMSEQTTVRDIVSLNYYFTF